MRSNRYTQYLASSPIASFLSLGLRSSTLLRIASRNLRETGRWLFTTREHSNFTFNLQDLNRRYLAAWVSSLTQATAEECLGYFDELQQDQGLAEFMVNQALKAGRGRIIDPQPRYGRRLGWYALVRILEPEVIVETGTDKGLGTMVLAAAAMRNGRGRVISIDINPGAGALVGGPWADLIHIELGSSIVKLKNMSDVDLFIHDSDHAYAYEFAEYEAVNLALRPSSVVLSDNAHASSALLDWSAKEGRTFHFFQENPVGPQSLGCGIGVSIAV